MFARKQVRDRLTNARDDEWVFVKEKWYYAEKGGIIVQDKTIKINNVEYTFDYNSVLVD
ncbi:hypothetical protein [Parvimonas parva]|nr:hypothetical protein [Parvimonas parva]